PFIRKEVASFLFEPKDAATMDRSTSTPWVPLLLMPFTPDFLLPDTRAQRSVQRTNRKLDHDIGLFLRRACPYFPAEADHKFHIHLFNVDDLVAFALPYHDTNLFVRVVQLLQIDEPNNKWNWLHCLQVRGGEGSDSERGGLRGGVLTQREGV
uniref:HEAT repeat-containing protein 1 n=1 Tax=Neogobius melanostomus TaxID=47308 RepID=A0A8C6SHL7_9GOBI